MKEANIKVVEVSTVRRNGRRNWLSQIKSRRTGWILQVRVSNFLSTNPKHHRQLHPLILPNVGTRVLLQVQTREPTRNQQGNTPQQFIHNEWSHESLRLNESFVMISDDKDLFHKILLNIGVEKRGENDESRELNAVIDVIMLAGTISWKWLRDSSVEDTMIRIAPFARNKIAMFFAMPAAIFFSIENTCNISRWNGDSSSIISKKVCDKPASRESFEADWSPTAFKSWKEIGDQALPYTKFHRSKGPSLRPFLLDYVLAMFMTLLAQLPPYLICLLYVERFVCALCTRCLCFRIDLPGPATGFLRLADLIIAGAVMPCPRDCSDKCGTGYHDQPQSTLVWARCLESLPVTLL